MCDGSRIVVIRHSGVSWVFEPAGLFRAFRGWFVFTLVVWMVALSGAWVELVP